MKAKSIIIAGVAIIAILIISAITALIVNSGNKRNFNNEKLLNGALTSENLQVSKDLNTAKSDLASITSKEETGSKALAAAQSRLREKEGRIGKLSMENRALMKDKNELVQLQKTNADLDKSYGDLKIEHETALSRIKELETSEIALDSYKSELSDKLVNMEKYRTDNVGLYASRGNKKDKPTIVARRTKELNLSFDSPVNSTDAITYKIITPSGKIINPEDKTSAWVVVNQSPQNMTASLSTASVEPENSWKLELKDNARDKLESGVYKIMIFSNDNIIGSYRLMLK